MTHRDHPEKTKKFFILMTSLIHLPRTKIDFHGQKCGLDCDVLINNIQEIILRAFQ